MRSIVKNIVILSSITLVYSCGGGDQKIDAGKGSAAAVASPTVTPYPTTFPQQAYPTQAILTPYPGAYPTPVPYPTPCVSVLGGIANVVMPGVGGIISTISCAK